MVALEAVRRISPVSYTHLDVYKRQDNWRPWHRVLFRLKAENNYKHLLRLIDPKTITHVHAHTLFSDGVLALKLKRDYGIPYTVTIRNADINVFMRFMVHTWGVGKSIMQNADKVICISPCLLYTSASFAPVLLLLFSDGHIEQARAWVNDYNAGKKTPLYKEMTTADFLDTFFHS